MEIGLEGYLHVEFEISKLKYHLKDCIEGQVKFMLVLLKIKEMKMFLIRKESTGSG